MAHRGALRQVWSKELRHTVLPLRRGARRQAIAFAVALPAARPEKMQPPRKVPSRER